MDQLWRAGSNSTQWPNTVYEVWGSSQQSTRLYLAILPFTALNNYTTSTGPPPTSLFPHSPFKTPSHLWTNWSWSQFTLNSSLLQQLLLIKIYPYHFNQFLALLIFNISTAYIAQVQQWWPTLMRPLPHTRTLPSIHMHWQHWGVQLLSLFSM